MKHETATWATGATSGAGKNVGARSGGKTGRLHVQKRLGKLGPQGRRARSEESFGALFASGLRKWGGTLENKAAIPACPQRKKCMLRSGTNCNSLMPR
jgi:hypothetical protein